jgi:putative radical SAM enzyme (TIGR03279 family)
MSEAPRSVEKGGRVAAVEPGSLGARLGLRPGDRILHVNGQGVEDVIDVQFYAAEDRVEMDWMRGEDERQAGAARRAGEALGIEFEHPTFDTDIRRCNNLCPFCFVLQTPPHMRRTLYIKDDDYRYSFLYGHFVTLTNLSLHDWARILEQRLSPLYVSVHATELAVRRACLSNPAAPDVLDQLKRLAEAHIETHTQIVLTPELNDGPHLDRSLDDLAGLFPWVRSCSVVPVGLTRHHKYGRRVFSAAECIEVVHQVETWQSRFRERFGSRFAFLTDEWYLATGLTVPAATEYEDLDLRENGLGMVRAVLDEWAGVRETLAAQAAGLRGRRAMLVTAPLFAPTLQRMADEFNERAGTQLEVVVVANERMGPSVTVAGLMMGEEVLGALRVKELGEAVILPRLMFDHPLVVSLDDVSPLRVARELGVPVVLVDGMGDVLDALRGESPLLIRPEDETVPPAVLRAGGWAVEKYLPPEIGS